MNGKRFIALLIAALLCLSPLSAFAEEYKIEDGSITVSANENGQTVTQVNRVTGYAETSPTVIKGNSTSNTVTIEAAAGYEAKVTFSGLTIDVHDSSNAAAAAASGQGDVTIELDGDNTLISGSSCAGLQKGNGGTLTIQDEDGGGSLTAQGGDHGAGIGGGDGESVSDITITGAAVTATAGSNAAGIGGGKGGSGTNIEITDSTVTASANSFGNGIGSGFLGGGSITVEIVNSDVTAVCTGRRGAGIGTGLSDSSLDVTVSGNASLSVAGTAPYTTDGNNFPEGPGIGHAGPNGGGISTEVQPHTDHLCKSGSIAYYPAGTGVSDIQNGILQPARTVKGQGHDPGDSEKENEIVPGIGTEGSYDLVTYCKDCGGELERQTVTVPALEPESEPEPGTASSPKTEEKEDAFTRFCKNVAKQIREAPENGTVEVDATPWPGFQRRVFQALAERPDVTLTVTVSLNGEAAKLTIPQGLDLLSSVGKAKVTGFEDLAKLLG